MKAFTDLEQSKKLAEILPIESEDMRYHTISHYNPHPCGEIVYTVELGKASNIDVPCWSLAALLNILDYPQLSKDKLGSDKEGWMISVYPDNCRYDSSWHDNPIDCCVEMICKIYEIYSEKYFLI